MPFIKKDHVKITDYDSAETPFAVYEPGREPVLCVSHKAAQGVAMFCPYPVQDLTNPKTRESASA